MPKSKPVPTAPYGLFKKWFEENRKTITSINREIEINGTKYAVRKACYEPLMDVLKAAKDQIGVKLLETAVVTSARGRSPVSSGDERAYTVGKQGNVVISAKILGVVSGEKVSVSFSNQKIVITKATEKEQKKQ